MRYTGNLIQSQEGESLKAYPDAGGFSIGFGHHAADVTEGETITDAQAQAYLHDDVKVAEAFVNEHITVPLTQGQFNSLVDFVFNVGTATVLRGTVLQLVNQSNFEGAAAKLREYVYSMGKKMPSLERRRIAESAAFEVAQ
jgi:lysozyme